MVTPGQLKRRAQFFDQLAATIAAGVTLPKALEMASKKRINGIPQNVIHQIIRHLQDGHTFSDAMQLLSGQKRGGAGMEVSLTGRKEFWLTDFDIALLSVGEETGRLDKSFKVLARYYATRAKIISDTLAKLITTVLTLHVFLIVFPLAYLVSFVLGLFNSDYSQCLPFIIEKTVVFGALYGTVYLFGFAFQGHRGEGWRLMVEAFFNWIPWLGKAIKYLALARLAMALDALTTAGVPIIKSWELAANASGSPRLKREIRAWLPELETGVTPADMVNQIHYFPEMFANLYASAEMSGKQEETLERLHTYYEDEGFQKMRTFAVALNFTIYFTIAIIIAYSIIRFWMNYYGALLNNV
jgi:type II secretory pathway component PulF